MGTKNLYKVEIANENENIRLKVNSFNKIEQDIFDWYCFTILDEYYINSISTAKGHYRWERFKEIIDAIENADEIKDNSQLIYSTKSQFTFLEVYKEKTIIGDLDTLINDSFDEALHLEELYLSIRLNTEKFKNLSLVWFRENINYRYDLGFITDKDRNKIIDWINKYIIENE